MKRMANYIEAMVNYIYRQQEEKIKCKYCLIKTKNKNSHIVHFQGNACG